MEKLKRCIVQAGMVSGQVDYNLLRRSVIKGLAIATLTVGPQIGWAEKPEIDLNLITLPTDLVAAISVVEDDIAISDLLQSSRPSSANEQVEVSSTSESNESSTAAAEAIAESSNIVDTEVAVIETDLKVEVPLVTSVPESESGEIQIVTEKPVSAGTGVSFEVATAPDSDTESEAISPTSTPSAAQQIAEFNTKIPALKLPATEQATKLITASAPDQAPLESDDTAVEKLAPAETVEQLVTEQQDAHINEDEIILAWATAWSNNNVEEYLSFYSEDFSPDDPSIDRASWEQLRRERLQNKDIRIIVSNAEVYRADTQITEVRFTQRYTSKGYRDRVIKSIEMVETPAGWKFLSERTIETLAFE
ncbi:MAG: L,D-transpeptidase Cds6 family protein [bacterium]